MGKAVPCGEGSGQAHPTAARDLRRLRRMLPEEFEQWQNRLDPARYDQAAAVEQ